MQSEFNGQLMRAVERLAEKVEELGRRQEALESLTQRIMAELRREQAELRQEQAELCRRQDAQSEDGENCGRRWRTYSADWERHLGGQIQQLEHFAQQLIALLPSEGSEE